jgi:hypothetical protein
MLLNRLSINRWKINFLKISINRALSIDDEYTRTRTGDCSVEGWDEDGDFADAKYEEALDILYFYQEFICKAALGELNSIIEYELKLVATHIYTKNNPKKKGRVNSREKAVKIIQSDGLNLEKLPGCSGVEKIRKTINAFKHEDGYSGEYSDFAGHYVQLGKKHELQPEQIIDFLELVEQFLLSLYERYPDVNEDPRIKFNL